MTNSVHHYIHPDRFLVSVDCIVFGFHDTELKILTFKRKIEPQIGAPSLLGGFVCKEESIDDAAKRVLDKLTGIDDLYMEQVATYGDLDRDPAGRGISIVYFALINIEDYDHSLLERYDSSWLSKEEWNHLIFDHRKMVEDALKRLRKKAATFDIGFNLLPEKFTLTQLQSLHEAIYSESLDKRNFRKKVLSLNILDKLEEKDKMHSRKGAYYYKLNENYR